MPHQIALPSDPMKTPCLLLLAAGLLAAGCATTNPPAEQLHPPLVAVTPAAHLLIVSATYGSGTGYADVTDRVNDLLRQPDVEFNARPQWLGADPTPGWNKALLIIYQVNGQRHLFTTGEGGLVSLPALLKHAGQ